MVLVNYIIQNVLVFLVEIFGLEQGWELRVEFGLLFYVSDIIFFENKIDINFFMVYYRSQYNK